ncbi:hypothetical protein HYC85_012593 [Camellia sinensis]|uniref:ZZ-type domain-containing protein n=1 Tax=Camellia sinensis TaxID=4442 RepID=A0A7J7HCD7_CAMSI|nr:hypothetical protein HYC85_012593 [Camellia sinensis]
MEVMSLYYIIKSGRPFCEGCDEFIPGMFFTCSECFENGTNNPFCVCPMCFENERFIHPSHKSNLFLDNYTLLEAKRQSAMATRIAAEAKQLEAKREEELLATFATFPRQNQLKPMAHNEDLPQSAIDRETPEGGGRREGLPSIPSIADLELQRQTP